MKKFPVLFVGHGSPMNAIENNVYTQGWKQIAADMEKPEAILSVSAHWYIKGTKVLFDSDPRTIHDFYGFSDELYKIQYKAQGAPEMAEEALKLIGNDAEPNKEWGLDHGTWSVLRVMYPDADIPVFQVSINGAVPAEEHYAIGRHLKQLREKNVLILGSGNIVHNLALARFDMEKGFDWAYTFDNYIYEAISEGRKEDVINPVKAGESAQNAFFSPDHYYPLLYVLGATETGENIRVYNKACVYGSISMTSYLFG